MHKLSIIAVAAALLAACADSSDSTSSVDAQLRSILDAEGHTADPLASRILPAITDPKPQLGKKTVL